MSDDVKPIESTPSVVDVQLELLNINGREKRGRVQRREHISKYFEGSDKKPDFLALIDGVCKIDVKEFCTALNKRWAKSKYMDIAYIWKGNQYMNEGLYGDNHEALLYDSSLWAYLDRNDLPIRRHDFSKFTDLIWNRFRAGVFRHKETGKMVYVVTYHGHQNGKTPERFDQDMKQACFAGVSLSL
jgi:hypothetical protein